MHVRFVDKSGAVVIPPVHFDHVPRPGDSVRTDKGEKYVVVSAPCEFDIASTKIGTQTTLTLTVTAAESAQPVKQALNG